MRNLPTLQSEIVRAIADGFPYNLILDEGQIGCPETGISYFIAHCTKHPQPCSDPLSILYRIILPSSVPGYTVVMQENVDDGLSIKEYQSAELNLCEGGPECSYDSLGKVFIPKDLDAFTMRCTKQVLRLYNFLDQKLFNGELPDIQIAYTDRVSKSSGFFRPASWKDEFGRVLPSINLPAKIWLHPEHDILLSLTVLMAAHRYHDISPPKTSGYYGSRFAEILSEIGIECKCTYGTNRRTGRHFTFQVIPGGLFDQVTRAVPPDLKIHFSPIMAESCVSRHRQDRPAQTDKTKTKYQCPCLKNTVWGKPNIHITCTNCDVPFIQY